jgi:hypothetical protein
MMPTLMQQTIVFGTLGLVLALFVWGRWRKVHLAAEYRVMSEPILGWYR